MGHASNGGSGAAGLPNTKNLLGMKYYLIAGEASGDLHGSNLMKGIAMHDKDADFRFFGGDLMAAVGGVLVKHYREMAFMGFYEVVKNLRKISKNFNDCQKDIEEYSPDVVILIDYPGFNFRIAKWAKERGIKVFYYIAPKVWAWKEGRVKRLQQNVDKLFTIFPFETEYFRRFNIEVCYEGNPLIDALEQKRGSLPSFDEFVAKNGLDGRPIVGLLAGSRKQEVEKCLPVMQRVADRFPDYQFVVAGAPSLPESYYSSFLANGSVRMVYNQTYDLFSVSTAALVTSGTATLEAALHGVPQAVCYRTSFLSALIAKLFIKVKWISLVNIIMNKEVVRELLQYNMTVATLSDELKALLPGGERHQLVLNEYEALKKMLGEVGSSERVGKKMVELLK